jgi:hypothetical protein
MSQAVERANQETSGARAYVLAGYYVLAGNFSLVLVLFGLGFIGLGATVVNGTPTLVFGGEDGIVSVLWGVPDTASDFSEVAGVVLANRTLAGMFGVWGTTFVLLGAILYGVLFANKMYARLTS